MKILGALFFVAACAGTSSTTALTPVTGILVRADALVAGIGCGTGSGQIYRYAAVVTQLPDNGGGPDAEQPVAGAGGIFECYADAAFRQLQPGPYGKLSFVVEIYAFSKAAYDAQNAGGALDRAAAGGWGQLQTFRPTYKTSCTATQQENVEVLAVCGPLSGSQVRVDTARFASTAGVDISCNAAYATVEATYRTGEETGTLPRVTCPAPVLIRPAQAPAAYQIDLRLLDASDAGVATAHCRASTLPGTQVTASCDPIP